MSEHARPSTDGPSVHESTAADATSTTPLADATSTTPLADARATIESLADANGAYRVVGARRMEEPVPARGLRFASRETARRAARAVERYRGTLREYDPALPRYRVVVDAAHTSASADDAVESSRSTATVATRSS
ncbi:hypothetical protein G9C85_15595 [Halorubellus sp. JP-L1]|uniref:DUF7552 domain-containing protein n=1 Tax=Halorubellus sp. JP-L1 TaxID=2715753 RepID=UPI00140ABBE2|nr:hypothetical protein [Halorubellus sp. JP-L1]NHN43042.1 hypothetical protein [Halorubellus sp. JP-L1]